MAGRATRWLKRIIGIVAVLAASFAGFLWWGAGGRQQPGERDDAIADHGNGPAPTGAAPEQLRVMTWNIAYARGTNPDNNANEMPSRALVERRLREMGALVRKHRVDVLLLQEVDFGARRSRYVDQLAALARHAGLRYAARATSWKSNWVPHPLWPPHKQYGRMLSGGGVLSRYPITKNRVLLHPKPSENGAIYNAFYLFRYSQFVTLSIGGRELLVVNNHLEAFKKKNRVLQAKLLSKRLSALPTPRPLMLLGGDLNTTPPEATRKTGFSDSAEDDYRDDATLATLRATPGLSEIVDPARYAVDEKRYLTFPTLAPTRRLDYIFHDEQLKLVGSQFLRPGAFSDHCPVLAVFTLRAATQKTPTSAPATSAPATSAPTVK